MSAAGLVRAVVADGRLTAHVRAGGGRCGRGAARALVRGGAAALLRFAFGPRMARLPAAEGESGRVLFSFLRSAADCTIPEVASEVACGEQTSESGKRCSGPGGSKWPSRMRTR